jgi:hypothetical protein
MNGDVRSISHTCFLALFLSAIPEDIKCPAKDDHKRCCTNCIEGFAIIEELRNDLKVALAAPNMGQYEKDVIGEYEQDLLHAEKNLIEFRSHLARHKAENSFNNAEFESLRNRPGLAIITADYKMKLLAVFFRENQKKWFGKSGTSVLGFMIQHYEDGILMSKFIFLVMDDTVQDEIQYLCAKTYIYQNELPEWIKEAIMRTDGAGCFTSQLSKLVQPCMFAWTGVKEIVNTHPVAGGGKSSLDQMFGVMGSNLKLASDQGMSYHDAPTVLEAMESTSGIPGSRVLHFEPDRGSAVLSAGIRGASVESVLRTELASDGVSLTAFKHSGYGTGRRLECGKDMFLFQSNKAPALLKTKLPDSFIQYIQPGRARSVILSYLDDESKLPGEAFCDTHRDVFPAKELDLRLLQEMTPSYTIIREAKNKKQDVAIQSKVVEGETRTQTRQRKRANRTRDKAARKVAAIEQDRAEMQKCSLYLCNVKNETTKRYCTGRFLNAKCLQRHCEQNKHHFLTGISSKDKLVLMASGAGGAMEVGHCPDRLLKNKTVTVIEASLQTPGIQAACCFQKFNQKEGESNYVKPKKLVEELKRLYDIVPKLTAPQMLEELRRMRDPKDGGMMFCYRKRGTTFPKTPAKAYREWKGCVLCGKKPCECNGMLLTVDAINNYIKSLTQQKKKNQKSDKEDS